MWKTIHHQWLAVITALQSSNPHRLPFPGPCWGPTTAAPLRALQSEGTPKLMGCKLTLLQAALPCILAQWCWTNQTYPFAPSRSPKTVWKCCHAQLSALFHVQARRLYCLSFSYCSWSTEKFHWGTYKLETGGKKELSTNCTVTTTHILLSAWLQHWKLHSSSCTCTWRCLNIQLLQKNPL